jgi:hypothetical protein
VPIPPEAASAAESALSEFCVHHSSADIADQLRYSYEIAANAALLLEQRPSFMSTSGEWVSRAVAKFRYSPGKGDWSLYWSDADDRWRRLSSVPASTDIRKLIKIVADDPSGVFWG